MLAPEALALVASSALFSFVLFKLLSFFLTPANLVLCFLIAAHPVGVLLADRWLVRRERRAVQLYLLALAWSVASLLFLRHLHPALPQPGARPGLALGDVIGFTIIAAASQGPFFLFTGVVELLALRAAERATGTTPRAYAVVLGGTAIGIGIGYAAIRWVGALGLTAVSAGIAAVLSLPRGRARLGAAAAAAIVVAATAARPSIDASWIGLIQPAGPSTAQEHLRRGGVLLFSRWDRHAYTQVIANGNETTGAYDNFKYWEVERERRPRDGIPADALIFHALAPDSAVAIVGVGGGRQVVEAQRVSPSFRIDAFEINESIVDFFTRLDPSANGGAYVAAHVRIIGGDGRRGIAEGASEYDCIYLPDAGTAFAYYRNLVADPQFLYTRESYQGYLSRLRPDGVIVTAFARPSNPDSVLTRRVTDILAQLDADVHVLTSPRWEVVVASRRGEAAATRARLDALAGQAGLTDEAPRAAAGERATGDDSGFHVPYFLYPVYDRLPGYFARAVAIGAAIAIACVVLLARRARRGPGGAAAPLLAIAALLGVSFVVLQNALVLSIARVLWSMTDAVILGSTFFLGCAVVGTFAAPAARRRSAVFVAIFAAALATGAWTALRAGSLSAMLAGWLPACVLSGALFPAVLERAGPAHTRFVYAADGVGALLGIVVVFFVPLLFGISAFGLLALGVCGAAACAVLVWAAAAKRSAASEGAPIAASAGEPGPRSRRAQLVAAFAIVAFLSAVGVAIRRAPSPDVGIPPEPRGGASNPGEASPAVVQGPSRPGALRPLDAAGAELLGGLVAGAPFDGPWRVEAAGIQEDAAVAVDLARPNAWIRLWIAPRGTRPHSPPARSGEFDVFYTLPPESDRQPAGDERLQLCESMAARLAKRGR